MADDKLLQAAKNNLDKLGDALGQQVGAELQSGNTNATKDVSDKLTKFKNSFANPNGTLQNIPEEVYKAIAEALNVTAKSIFTTYSSNGGELIQQIAANINTLLPTIADKKVPVIENGKKVYYTIKFNLPSNGVVQVSKGKESSILSWKTKGETSGKNAMAQYMVSLANLEKSLSLSVLTELGKVFKSKGAELFKLIFKGDVTESELKKFLGNSVYNKIKGDKIKSAINSVVSSINNKKITNAVTQYKSLNTTYENLVAESKSSKKTNDSIKSKSTAFTTAAKKVQSSLKSLGVTVSLEILPAPSIGLTYDKNSTAVTVPAGYTSELKTSDYKSSVKTIYAGDFTKAVIINGNAKDNTIYCGTGNDKLYGLAGKDVLYGYSGKDTIYGGAGNDTLYGGAGNDSLFGEADSDKLYGEAGDDTLGGGAGSDTLTGGAGKDVFYYSSGDGADTITDYTAGDDKIKIASGKIDKVTMSGTTVMFKVGSGSIKVQNVKDKEITVVYASNKTSKYRNGKLVSGGGDEPDTITGGGVTVTLSADTTGTFDLTTYNKTSVKKATNVDARASKNGLTLYGDDRANTIWAPNNVKSSYWSGSIYAGKGNDNIYCGSGNDDICYYKGDGNETVYNFKTGDDIYLYNGVKFKNVTLSGKDVILNLDSGNTITLKNAKSEKIYISGYDTNGNSVGTLTFSSSSSKNLAYSADMAEDYWFMSTMESNVVGDLDSLMREIPSPDSSVVSFSTDSVNDPNKLLNSITFAQVTKKK